MLGVAGRSSLSKKKKTAADIPTPRDSEPATVTPLTRPAA
jgi:hypothetical protein